MDPSRNPNVDVEVEVKPKLERTIVLFSTATDISDCFSRHSPNRIGDPTYGIRGAVCHALDRINGPVDDLHWLLRHATQCLSCAVEGTAAATATFSFRGRPASP